MGHTGNPLPDRHPGWDKWLRRRQAAVDDWQHPLGPSINVPTKIFIKGDVAFQVLNVRSIKGDTAFTASAVFIKGDTSLIGVRQAIIRGDVRFTNFAAYIKGDVTLAINVPLGDLGEDPADTKPGAISRFWLSVAAVTKDVT